MSNTVNNRKRVLFIVLGSNNYHKHTKLPQHSHETEESSAENKKKISNDKKKKFMLGTKDYLFLWYMEDK